jgi:hypothetical protein
MTEADIDKLITSFKEANKNLRKKAITIGALMIITIGLVNMESIRLTTVVDLLNYQEKLEAINKLQDTTFKSVMDDDSPGYYQKCALCSELDNLFLKIKANDYDRKILVNAIEQIDVDIKNVNADKSISILGFSIPVRLMYYVFFFIMLILFHDFTQVIIFRKKVYREIRMLHTPDWKLGFELFGFYSHPNKPSLRFANFTSSLITCTLIICPLATSFMMMRLISNNNEVLTILNFLCLLFIVTDTVIIVYTENLLNFRFLSNVFLGNYGLSRAGMKTLWKMVVAGWSFILFFIMLIGFNGSIPFQIAFFLLCTIPLMGLYFVMMKCFDTPNKKWKGIRASFLIANFCWLSLIVYACNPSRTYHFDDLVNIIVSFLVICLCAMLISVIYIRVFFMDVKTNRNKLPNT